MNENNKWISNIYIDNFLDEKLREHQREGVKFLVKCISGINDCEY